MKNKVEENEAVLCGIYIMYSVMFHNLYETRPMIMLSCLVCIFCNVFI